MHFVAVIPAHAGIQELPICGFPHASEWRQRTCAGMTAKGIPGIDGKDIRRVTHFHETPQDYLLVFTRLAFCADAG